ncbi:reverse transcriptase domain-containing protein [Tanacetum coccineum]
MPATTPLIGFIGEIIWLIGQIQLLVKIRDEEHSTSAWMNFVVVRLPSPYNGIIGRPRVRKLQAVSSTAHGMIKLPVEGGVITLKSSRLVSLECATVSRPEGNLSAPKQKGCSPIRQKKRGQAADRNQAIQEEVGKLVEAGIMKEMPFGLRNARETYQHLVDKAFHKQIGRNLKVYVDDVVIKSHTEDEIVRDIEEMFKTLREINMKLNPKKCTFGVEEGMFLGYKVNTKGLKVCPNKVDVVLSLQSLKCLKDVQKLIAEEAFKKMNQLIAELPMLTAPMGKKRNLLSIWQQQKRRPRVSVKGQILADFIVERPEEDSPDTLMEAEEELPEPWILFTDGSSYTDGSRAGLILTNPEGMEFTYALRFRTYAAKEADMIRYLEKVRTLTNSFKAFSIRQVPRSENKKADALSKIASTSFAHLSKQVLVEELKEKSISEVEILAVVEEQGDIWMTTIFEYLTEETLPADVKKQGQNPQQKLTLITSPWPFYKWGIDIARPFPKGPGKVKFLIVAIDYFTKWTEAKPVTTITDWCKKLCIRRHFASVKHPKTNGLVERANRSLGEEIKARLGVKNKKWLEELSHVLWAHRTMIKSSKGETLFSLTYGKEAVILAEIGMPTLRTAEQSKNGKYYNSKVQSISFKPGDLVYRNNDASHAEDIGKLGPKWEGPYEVTKALGKSAYKLRDHDGKQLL